jgi:2-polyprenyl-3-methyl-5-hydroxy-6-metoxy-1,4-benzoquinol methylase
VSQSEIASVRGLSGNKYHWARREIVPYISASARRVLDVGAANGDFGTVLKEARPHVRLWGVEPVPGAIEPGVYEEIYAGEYPSVVPATSRFDVIVFNDVLEHMADPWAALRRTKALLADGWTVVASIPNVRNLRTMTDLVLRGRWEYTEYGVLDRTHLRFFTPASMRDLFRSTGFEVLRQQAINLPVRGRRGWLRRAAFGRLDPVIAEQFVIVGRPTGSR